MHSTQHTPALAEFYEQSIFHHANAVIGPRGLGAIKSFAKAIREVYHYCEPGQYSNFYIQMSIQDVPEIQLSTTETLQPDALLSRLGPNMIVHVLRNNRYRIQEISAPLSSEDLLLSTFTYCYNHKDIIWVQERQFPLSDRDDHSVYCKPTYSQLIQTLDHYAIAQALNSTCIILSNVWHDPHNKNVLIDKPEQHMRRSLESHLRSALSEVVILPEQNCDESKPVDIVVVWRALNREALIEIKWLGDNCNKTPYRDGRARDGYRQLAAYLSQRRVRQASVVIKGFLVVFDARRGSDGDKAKYRNVEIDYQDLPETGGQDIHTVRVFLLPVL
jgi:hypothetical protein